MHDRRRAASPPLVLALAAALAGCTALEPYPPPVAEICGNRVDDDWDGVTDCEGPPCAGTPACAEETNAQCTNGVDDDGDGRVDLADARCWPGAHVDVERCASVLGGDRTSDQWTGSVMPGGGTGLHTGSVWTVLPAMERILPDARAGVTLAGDIEGLEASVVVYLDRPGSAGIVDGMRLALFDARAFRESSYPITLSIEVHEDGTSAAWLTLRAPSGDVQSDMAFGFVSLDAWATLELAVHDGVVSASVLGRTASLSLALPQDYPPSRPLTLGVSSGSSDAPGFVSSVAPVVGEAHLRRAPWLRCQSPPAEATTPPTDLTDASVGSSFAWLAGIVETGAPGALCALSFGGDLEYATLDALAVQDETRWTERETVLAEIQHQADPPTASYPGAVSGGALALGAGGELRAIVAQTFEAGTASEHVGLRLFVGDAASCGAWGDRGELALPDVAGRTLSLLPPVRFERLEAGWELDVILRDDTVLTAVSRVEIRTFRSATGEPGSWTADAEGDHALFDALDAATPERGLGVDLPRIRHVGARDIVATVRRWNGDLELWALAAAGWVRIRDVTLTPSGEESTFDADALVSGELVLDESSATRTRARVFYTGLYDVVTGTVSPAGFGPLRLTFTPPGVAN